MYLTVIYRFLDRVRKKCFIYHDDDYLTSHLLQIYDHLLLFLYRIKYRKIEYDGLHYEQYLQHREVMKHLKILYQYQRITILDGHLDKISLDELLQLLT